MLALKEVYSENLLLLENLMPHASKLRVCCARQLYTAESHVMSLGKLHHTALLSLLDFYIVNKQIFKYR